MWGEGIPSGHVALDHRGMRLGDRIRKRSGKKTAKDEAKTDRQQIKSRRSWPR